MAKCRIGHFAEARVLEALGVDFIDESEVLTPADEAHHVLKTAFTVPFVCGCRDLGEALRSLAVPCTRRIGPAGFESLAAARVRQFAAALVPELALASGPHSLAQLAFPVREVEEGLGGAPFLAEEEHRDGGCQQGQQGRQRSGFARHQLAQALAACPVAHLVVVLREDNKLFAFRRIGFDAEKFVAVW